MMERRVVLPTPFGPTSPHRSPGLTMNETRSKTRRSAKRLARSLTRSMVGSSGAEAGRRARSEPETDRVDGEGDPPGGALVQPPAPWVTANGRGRRWGAPSDGAGSAARQGGILRTGGGGQVRPRHDERYRIDRRGATRRRQSTVASGWSDDVGRVRNATGQRMGRT